MLNLGIIDPNPQIMAAANNNGPTARVKIRLKTCPSALMPLKLRLPPFAKMPMSGVRIGGAISETPYSKYDVRNSHQLTTDSRRQIKMANMPAT